MRHLRALHSSVALLALTFGTAPATASEQQPDSPLRESREIIVLIGTSADRGFIGRLAAELQAMKMDIDLRTVEADAGTASHEVDLAVANGARAILRADSRQARIDLLFADPATRRLTLRLSLNGSQSPIVEPLLATRAVEFVRAMLLGEPLVLPTVAPVQLPAEPAPRSAASIVISSGVAVAQGNLPAQGELAFQVRITSPRFLGLNLFVLAPVTTASVQGEAATNARTAVWLGGGDLFLKRDRGRRVSLDLGIGGFAAAMRVVGNPSAGWTGGARVGVDASAYVHLGASLALTRRLAVRADLLLGGTFQRLVASAGGPNDYPWGRTFAAALAGIEARLY